MSFESELGPVFILGSERSGTNLLRAILQSHSQIASPPPAGFIDALGGSQPFGCVEGSTGYCDQLISDVVLMTTTHHTPWDVTLDPIKVSGRLGDDRSIWGVFRAVNDIYCETKGKKFLVSKEPGLFKHVTTLSKSFPSGKFLYLVRDGRDVAASMLRGHLHEFHIYFAAHSWAHSQRLCLQAINSTDVASKIYLIKYESLISDPVCEVRKIMEFLGIPFEEKQLDFHKNSSVLNHAKRSKFWRNLAKPIDKNNSGLYKKQLNETEIKIFESVAGAEMRALGYKLDSNMSFTVGENAVWRYKKIAAFKKWFWGLDPRAEARRSKKRGAITREIMTKYQVRGGK